MHVWGYGVEGREGEVNGACEFVNTYVECAYTEEK